MPRCVILRAATRLHGRMSLARHCNRGDADAAPTATPRRRATAAPVLRLLAALLVLVPTGGCTATMQPHPALAGMRWGRRLQPSNVTGCAFELASAGVRPWSPVHATPPLLPHAQRPAQRRCRRSKLAFTMAASQVALCSQGSMQRCRCTSPVATTPPIRGRIAPPLTLWMTLAQVSGPHASQCAPSAWCIGPVPWRCNGASALPTNRREPYPYRTPTNPAVERCLRFCGYVLGCNAVVYCNRMGGCGGSKAATGSGVGECTLLAIKDAAAPAPPAGAGGGFVSAVIRAAPAPPYCAGLHRHACEACSASKDSAGCADCTRRAANQPRQYRGAGGGIWQEARGTQLPGSFETHIGCARCFNESAAPGVCAECLRAGPRNSTCWACVMRSPGIEAWRSAQSMDACVACALKFGRMWAESCE